MTIPKSVQPTQHVAGESDMDDEPAAGIDAAIQGALGRRLRESYEEVVREEVPDKFRKLLDDLKLAESDRGPAGGNAGKG
ncbi:hypothetical protein W911_07955 [Hyphomicrobium nitrativorans NL23]|uniref:Anti-sigma factor NepR domain-containing protein n=1 Tax=Hyphomicrobium nitrativorans NL23 TaxID=1029756 RepID=V5SE73_9HYPH|nr:NepR family anti-sigma factor [Hyphomicrobium nitrativorans]AHB48345.1 hypothetical protein W911_07955 [Hyphomicrobium nitrativorans NL23]